MVNLLKREISLVSNLGFIFDHERQFVEFEMFEKIFIDEELKSVDEEGEKFKNTFTSTPKVDLDIPKFKV